MSSRVTRVGVGLVALIPLCGIAGGVLAAVGVGAESTAWTLLVGGFVWIVAVIWWSLRAPPARSADAGARYWAALRHARFRADDDPVDETPRDRRTRPDGHGPSERATGAGRR